MQQQLSYSCGSRGVGLSGSRRFGRRVAPRLVVRAHGHASFPEEQEAEEQPSTSYSPAARRAYAHIVAPQRIGAEYGEGFLQFRHGGEPRRLDVAALNEQLKAGGALRMRFQLRPDEAYGTVFDFDTVIADTAGAYRRAWRRVAAERGLPLHPLARLSMHNTAPERIIMDVNGLEAGQQRQQQPSQSQQPQLQPHQAGEPQPGVRDWLNALTSFNVPVALVSVLDKATVRRALERMHLHDHFQVLVTAEDELESTAQRYLSAALQMQRPPNMCAVFGATPEAVTAAHNCTMKAVAVAISPDYPAYKLRTADVTVASLDQLTVYNLRRLFANAGDEFMDLRKQRSDDQPRNKRRTANAML
ncbi:hypothetical protein VOLCADRAFT_61265 [Volvox carteri f. nagariensis]|uniref:Uncharacterized protein n=1 Tax=Volvox carteri f. nagariensis TaxID=3068 RepID=D8TY16_VOLCA|nr:uncharacterized protein VOLCADRAFT_61265 [Volvox carteri f. nagariensis]EFJ47472.1 hypothetical protein VOLCADRAFT_61265 [Volvox carteri f. nagariensis]|eukprot:XP_002951296.1 hypothetical protein VOLCADRAFT_61265 [Volvox carteri f. nagariensis]